MKSLYKQVEKHLCKTLSTPPEGNALKRIHSLSGFITGMIRKGNSSLEALGSGVPKNIAFRSKTVAAERFVKNKWTDYDSHFLPFLVPFLKSFLAFSISKLGVRFVIDGTQVGKDNAALMISFVWQKRGVPICWFVKKGSKGHFKVADHIAVLEHFAAIIKPLLSEELAVTILGDGEFDSIEIQQFCLNQSWNYALRTACNTVLYENGDRFYPENIAVEEGENHVFIADIEFTKAKFQYVQLVVQHDTKHKDPIFLISNLECGQDIMDYYDERYSIECLFRDVKTTSFNLHLTRLKEPEHVSNLIIIAALAFILLLTLGIQYNSLEWRKKVQRVRNGRKVLAFFTFAFLLLAFLLDNDVPWEFSFHFPKNEDDFFKGYT